MGSYLGRRTRLNVVTGSVQMRGVTFRLRFQLHSSAVVLQIPLPLPCISSVFVPLVAPSLVEHCFTSARAPLKRRLLLVSAAGLKDKLT